MVGKLLEFVGPTTVTNVWEVRSRGLWLALNLEFSRVEVVSRRSCGLAEFHRALAHGIFNAPRRHKTLEPF
jgi:hypothetical protein